MNKTYLKNILRDIKNTKGKVFSIAAMVALAAAVVVGLTLSGTNMRYTLDNSLKTYVHPDIIVSSTYGLNYEDELILNRDSDIKSYSMIKTADLLEGENLIRVKSFNQDIPKSYVTKGRLPEKNTEIALDNTLSDKYKIGDEIKFSYVENSRLDDEVMNNLDYTIVGFFHTSDYFMEDMRELSFTAKKELNGYGYILEENFDTDKYGEMNIIYEQTSDMDINSNEYRDFAYSKKDEIEDKLTNRPNEVISDIKADVNSEISDAEEEIADAKKELTDAEIKLSDAKDEIDKGFRDYEDGKEKFENEIQNAKDELQKSKRELDDASVKLNDGKASYRRNLEEFNDKISKARTEIQNNERELNSSKAKLDEGYIEIDAAYKNLDNEFKDPKAELAKAKIELDTAKSQIESNEKNLNDGLAQIESSNTELDNKAKELNELEASINSMLSSGIAEDDEEITGLQNSLKEGRAKLSFAKLELEETENELNKAQRDVKEAYESYYKNLEEYNTNKAILDEKYNNELAKIDRAKSDLDQKQAELDNGYNQLQSAKNELDRETQNGRASLDNAIAQINANERKIDQGYADYNAGLKTLREKESDGKEELAKNYQQLLDANDEYQENLESFNKEKSDALDEIASGEEDIKEGKKALLKLVDPEYSVETIYDNEGIKTYHQNSLNMDELTKVFPTFFYLVAMLVTLTTMKRYIDEQRTINGTLKALGYTNSQISKRFYLYGIIPTLIGSIIGALIGRFVIVDIIINAYSSGFANIGIDYHNTLPYILFAILLSVALIALTVYFSSKETVKQSAASLLRVKSPNIGKKILLEKIDPIWKSLSFMQKVTARNLFRYKARMFMTLFGVGGCTALTFFGFAMIDSIKDTVSTQQNEINHYDVIAILDENANDDDIKKFNDAIKDYNHLDIRYDKANINASGLRRELNLVIPSNTDKISDFVTIRTPKGDDIDLSNEDVVITEKASKVLNISPDDNISIKYDGKSYDLPVSNIAENYTGDYIYIGSESFKKLTGAELTYNANYLKGDADKVISNVENEEAVVALINASVIYASMDVLLGNLNLVIGVITLISAMLALVVLYNLININVSERKRELATIKVLGFFPKEVTGYIFREIFILSILGIVVGYALGYAMFRFIISVVAPENIMLYYGVRLRPFIYSALITISITLVLLLIEHNRLKNIDMAEAMGSGE